MGARTLHVSKILTEKYSPEYEHAETMYNLPAMKNRKMKFGIGVFGSVAMGAILPVVACNFQQRKAKGAG